MRTCAGMSGLARTSLHQFALTRVAQIIQEPQKKPVELKKKGGKPHNNHPYAHRLKFDLIKGLILIDTEQMSKGTICCSLGLTFDSMKTATSHGTWAQTLARWPCHLSVVSNTGPGEASTVIGRLSAQQISEGPAVDTTI